MSVVVVGIKGDSRKERLAGKISGSVNYFDKESEEEGKLNNDSKKLRLKQ